MSSFKFIHTADLHLDSPFKGIRDIAGQFSTEIISSTFRAFDQVLEYCLELEVDFLLIAGDIFDKENRNVRAEIYFARGMERLRQAGIKVYLIHGNHDPLTSKQNNYNWPDNVHTFPASSVTRAAYPNEDLTVAEIFGRSYPQREFTENLLPEFAKKHQGKKFSIALHHTNVDGDKDYDPYAPTSLREIKMTDYDYWALGHFHYKGTLNEREPMIVYSGNTQGRHINERGLKECHYVEIVDNQIINTKWLPTSQIVWEQIGIDVTGLTRLDQLIDLIDETIEDEIERYQRPLIIRLLLSGRSELYLTLKRGEQLTEIEASLNEHYKKSEFWVIIESIQINLRPLVELEQIIAGDSFLADYLKENDKHKLATISDKTGETFDFAADLLNNRSFRKHFRQLTAEGWSEVEEFARAYAIDSLFEEENQ